MTDWQIIKSRHGEVGKSYITLIVEDPIINYFYNMQVEQNWINN